LYAARGLLIPFNSNSPTGSTFTAFSTFVSTLALMRICPGFASSHKVPDEDWEHYVEPRMRREMLCQACYTQIKPWVDEAEQAAE
jgi:hypothetical protein